MGHVAYLVLAHGQAVQFRRLTEALRAQGEVFAHIDAKADIDRFRINDVRYTPQRIDVRWGGFSMVEATLALLTHALENDPDISRFVLLSGDSFPLAPPAAITTTLVGDSTTNYISTGALASPETMQSMTRLTRYHFERTPRQSPIRPAWSILNRLIRRDYRSAFGGMVPHCGSQWWALTRPAAEWTLDEIDRRPEYVEFCRHTEIPDEHFFQTLLANSPFADANRPSIMYADWSGPTKPAIITREHVVALRNSPPSDRVFLFVRKMTDESEDVAALIRSAW